VLVTSTICVVLTGLPEVLFPGLPDPLVRLLKLSMGPLSGAIALSYLGIWLGGVREDVIVAPHHRLGVRHSALLRGRLGVLAVLASSREFHRLLEATAVINLVSVLLAIVTALRAATMGDPLARWMVLACLCLAGMVSGLYLRSLNIAGFGLGTWIFTAACTVAYFLIVSALVIIRNRQKPAARAPGGPSVGGRSCHGPAHRLGLALQGGTRFLAHGPLQW